MNPDLSEALDALEPFAQFIRQWNRQPMRGLDDIIYAIHTGSEYEAELKRSDCQRALDVVTKLRG